MDLLTNLTPADGVALLAAIAVKGSLLFLLAFLVVGLLRRTSAATRHAVWTFALGAAFVLPVLFVALPGWQVPVLPGPAVAPTVSVAPTAPRAPVAPRAPRAPAAPAPPASEHRVHGEVVTMQRHSSRAFVVEQHTAVAPAVSFGVGPAGPEHAGPVTVLGSDWRAWLLFVWLAGVAVVALRWVFAVFGAWRLVQHAEPVYDLDWLELKERIAFGMDLDRPVRLLRSDRVSVPIAGGVFDPVVVLPRDADTWSEERREVVLTHEMAHIVRRDCLTQTLAQGALALHWFNPLAWMSYRRFMLEREHACDDFVLNHGARASDYAQHLVQIARRFRRESLALAATAPMARRSNLEGRILSILDSDQNREAASTSRLTTVGVLTLALVAPLAALQPVKGEADGLQSASIYELPALPSVSVIASARRASDDTFTWEGRVGSGGFVEIHGVNGSVRARTGTGDRVRVEAEKKSRRGQEDEVEIIVREFANGVALCAVYPGQRDACEPGQGTTGNVRDNDVQVNFEVVVPESVRFLAHTVNGSIKTETLGGDVEARTVNGSIETASQRGNVTAKTVNGSIRAEAAGLVRANTTNGSIKARLGRAEWDGRMAYETTNGSITLELPDSFDAEVRAKAGTGSIKSDFPLRIQRNGHVGSEAEGRIGSGGRELHLEVLNGSIILRREPGSFGARIGDELRREQDRERMGRARGEMERDHEQMEHELREVERAMAEIGPVMELAMAEAGRAMADIDFEGEIALALDEVDWDEIRRDIEEAQEEIKLEMQDVHIEVWDELESSLTEALDDVREERADLEDDLREAKRDLRVLEADGSASRAELREHRARLTELSAQRSVLRKAERGVARALHEAHARCAEHAGHDEDCPDGP